jgi:hypothetical protein
VDISALFHTSVSHRDRSSECGAALIVALMAMLLMMALGTALILTTSTESKITRNFKTASEALYAADAVLERAVDDLRTISDWSATLSGAVQSTFVDGAPAGQRALADGQRIDLGEIVNLANCHKVAACSSSDMDDVTAERPWGPNNPRWQPFAWGRLNDIMPARTVNSPFYVVVMVADDPSDNDGDPLRDGRALCAQGQVTGCNPGTGVIALRAEAFGPFGAHKILELTISRTDLAGSEGDYNDGSRQVGIRILSWREMR